MSSAAPSSSAGVPWEPPDDLLRAAYAADQRPVEEIHELLRTEAGTPEARTIRDKAAYDVAFKLASGWLDIEDTSHLALCFKICVNYARMMDHLGEADEAKTAWFWVAEAARLADAAQFEPFPEEIVLQARISVERQAIERARCFNLLEEHASSALGSSEHAAGFFRELVMRRGRRDFAIDLGEALQEKGVALLLSGEVAQAAAAADEALVVLSETDAAQPSPPAATCLANALAGRAAISVAAGDEQAAVGFMDRAIALRQRVVAGQPDATSAQRLSRALAIRAQLLVNLGHGERAIPGLEQAARELERYEQDGDMAVHETLGDVYRLLSAAYALGRNDTARAQAIAERCVATLETAVHRKGMRALQEQLNQAYELRALTRSAGGRATEQHANEATCERCGAGRALDAIRCPSCGLPLTFPASLMGMLPAVGVGTLFATVALAMVRVVGRWLPRPSHGSGGIESFLGMTVELGNHLLVPAGGYLVLVLAGLAVGLYVYPKTAVVRLAGAAAAGLLGGLLFLAGGQLGWLNIRDTLWGTAPVLALVGAALSFPLRERASRWPGWILFGIPKWFGATRAVVWIPLAAAAVVLATYAGAAMLIIVLFLLGLYVLIKILGFFVGGGKGSSSEPGSWLQPSQPSELQPDPSPSYFTDANGHSTGTSRPGQGMFGGGDSTWYYDEKGNLTGHTRKDGTRYDAQNNFIGTSQRVKTTWGDATELRDANNNITGWVRDDGLIVDATGRCIGTAKK